MRKTLLFLVALAALTIAAPAGAATHTVSITAVGFAPNQLTVAVGDSVTWTNQDRDVHQVVSQDAGFSSPILKPNETFSYTFTKAGKFTVVDAQSKNAKMTVTVTSTATPPGNATISLAAAPTIVTYGGKVTLSGTLSTQKAGEQLTIQQQPCGASAFATATTVTTTTGGAYTFAVQPTTNTTYRVQFKNATSTTVSVRVRPRITLGKVAPRRFTVTVRAGASFAAKAVAVQRFNASTRRWILVRYATLRAGSGSVAPTVTSAVTFTLNVRPRTKVRVVMGTSTAGSCFAPGVSNTVIA